MKSLLPKTVLRITLIIATVAVPSISLAASAPAGVVFTTPPQTIDVDVVSEKFTVQTQDESGEQAKVPTTACLKISSSSSTGEFSSSATSWKPVSVLTISKNSANRSFYYKDAEEGIYALDATIVLRPEAENRSCPSWPEEEWPEGLSVTQEITVGNPPEDPLESEDDPESPGNSPPADETASTPPSEPASSSGGGTTYVHKPEISVSAEVSNKTIVGADTLLEAFAVGIQKEPLLNARYIWSFGDGASAEGKRVYHTYHYPGSYVVLVEASSGEWSAVDRKDITVIAPTLVISSIKEGSDGFIEIKNTGKDDIELSRWFLHVNGSFFTFPSGTLIRAGKSIPFPSAITKLLASTNAELLYPNGKVVVRYESKVVPSVVVPKVIATPTPSSISEVVPPKKMVTDSSPIVQPSEISKEVSDIETTDLPLPNTLAAAETGSGNFSPWLLSVFALSIVAAGGYIFSSRNSTKTSTETKELSAKDFEIIEDNN